MSTKGARTTQAAENSAAYKAKTYKYTGVDGRVYQTEEKMPSTEIDFKNLFKQSGHGFPSLIEVYRCDHYLSGKGRFAKLTVPVPEKRRLLSELSLAFDPKKNRYTADANGIWEYFQAKYPEKIAAEKIQSYDELVYRARYAR